MSWHFSRALVVEFLGANFSDGEPSAPLSSSLIPQAYLYNGRMTAFSRLSRFGMTFAPLTESRGEELLMLYLAGFPAKTLASPAKAQELVAQDRVYGESLPGFLAKYDRNLRSWRTAQHSLCEGLESYLETWPKWGLMLNGECWELATLGESILERESGLLPTIRKSGQSRAFKAYSRENYQGNLEEALGKLGYQGYLNPRFSEALMGFPIGWTDITPAATPNFQRWQQQHGDS